MPVGLLPAASYEQSSVALRPGDLLVIVSDGMVEACNAAGDFWEEEEVDRVVMSHKGDRLHLLTEELCHAVDCFADGAQQYDDMTIVAVRVV